MGLGLLDLVINQLLRGWRAQRLVSLAEPEFDQQVLLESGRGNHLFALVFSIFDLSLQLRRLN